MKQVLIQTIMKNRRHKRVTPDPMDLKIQKASDGLFVFIVFVLAAIVIGSISVGA